METIARETFLARLMNEWQSYPERFARLSPAEQRAYLEQQGYKTFISLLGHVIAWWQDGAVNIQQMRGDAAFPLAEYDVNDFNARAVEKYRSAGEEAMLFAYDAQRQAMRSLIGDLSDAELAQHNINTRLYYEIIMHWKEHELS